MDLSYSVDLNSYGETVIHHDNGYIATHYNVDSKLLCQEEYYMGISLIHDCDSFSKFFSFCSD